MEKGDAEDLKPHMEEAEDAALLFFLMQSLLFLVLGCLVNRLRVAFGPPMTHGLASLWQACSSRGFMVHLLRMVLAAALAGPKLFPLHWRQQYPRLLLSFLLLLFFGHLGWILHRLPCISDAWKE